MPCFHPLTAYKAAGGGITFKEGGDSGSQLQLPCGRCIGCRKRRTREWAIRCLHEASQHQVNSFITLTYENQFAKPGLEYGDFQKFIRRLRKATGPVRYFVAGEYGEQTFRPHWHALLFGKGFSNLQQIGEKLYTSQELAELWPYGFSSIGEVNYTTAGYVASYCIKKATGKNAENKYTRFNTETGEIIKVAPEMARMSLKPGLGLKWYEKYMRETSYARDAIIQQGGKSLKTPRYYDKILQLKDNKQYIENETVRILNAIERQGDNTKQRLLDKEINEIAKHSMKRRKL